MSIKQGWLEVARRVPSPNCNERPGGEISLLVIHSISLPPGEFGGNAIEQLFTNSLTPGAHPYFAKIHELRVSAHLLIRRDGECVQFVPFHQRAWHAGRSRWQDRGVFRQALNDFSIGIELEGDEVSPYTHAQYLALCRTTRGLVAHYPEMSIERIVGHAHVAPLRKNDPGPAFDWAYFYQHLGRLANFS
jgi:AmpD protein